MSKTLDAFRDARDFYSFLPYPPQIHTRLLPPAEREDGRFIGRNLSSLQQQVIAVSAAVALFDKSLDFDDPNRLEWRKLAAKMVTIELADFAMVKAAINKMMKRCPEITKLIGVELSQANRDFDNYFPGLAKIRHNSAHTGEKTSTPEKISKDLLTGPVNHERFEVPGGSSIFVGSAMVGDKITATVDNTVAELEISTKTVKRMTNVLLLIYKAFERVEGGLLDKERRDFRAASD